MYSTDSLHVLFLLFFYRLTIPLAFVIAFVIAFTKVMSFGPIFHHTFSAAETCNEYGWRNILYINNFFDEEEMVSLVIFIWFIFVHIQFQCIPQTWYLAVDMQLYILSPIIIYPLWKFPKIGLALATIVYLALTSVIGYLVLEHDLPLTASFISG